MKKKKIKMNKSRQQIIDFLNDPSLYDKIIEKAREKQYFELKDDEILAGGCPSTIITNLLYNTECNGVEEYSFTAGSNVTSKSCEIDYKDIDIFNKITKREEDLIKEIIKNRESYFIFKRLLKYFETERKLIDKNYYLKGEDKIPEKVYERFYEDKKKFYEIFKDYSIEKSYVVFNTNSGVIELQGLRRPFGDSSGPPLTDDIIYKMFDDNKEFFKDYLLLFYIEVYSTTTSVKVQFYSEIKDLLNYIYFKSLFNFTPKILLDTFDINSVQIALQNGKIFYTNNFVDFLFKKELKIIRFNNCKRFKTGIRILKKY